MTRLLDNGATPLKYKEKMFNEKNIFLLMKTCLMFLQ